MIESGQVININRTISAIGELTNVLVEKALGEGKYGTIWKLRDQAKKGQYYVLEHLREIPDEALIMRLKEGTAKQSELSILPQAYDLIQLEDDSVIILGEYVEGTPLSEWAAMSISRPWEAKKEVFIRLLQYIKEVQERMPGFQLDANKLLITPEDNVKICGHGIIQYPVPKLFVVAHTAPEIHSNNGKVESAARANVFTLGSILYTFIKGEEYWRALGYETPPYSAMTEAGQPKDGNILDVFDLSFEYPVEVASAIRIATNFRAEKRFSNVGSFLRHFNQEAIPEVKALPAEPIFKPEKKQPVMAATQPVQPSKPKTKLRKESIAALIALLAILVLGGTYMMRSGTEKVPDLTLDERKDWNIAIDKNTEFYYRKYLTNHPNGEYTALAFDMMDSIYNAPIDESELLGTRFTGKYTQSADRKVFSMRFDDITPNGGDLDFKCSINMGAQRKILIGSIDRNDYMISFEELGEDYPKLSITNGRVYKREGKIFIESTDVEQYWVLRD